MGKIKIFAVLLLVVIVSGCASSKFDKAVELKQKEMKQKEEVYRFFNNYIKLSENFDPAVFNLYKDTAKIYVNYRDPLRRIEITGAQFKKMGARILELSKKRGEISKYSKIVLTPKGNQVKIKADRYSIKDKYLDKSYYMVVEKGLDGKYLIVKEFVETDEIQKPVEIKSFLEKLKPVIDRFNKSLPKMLDGNTRIDKVEIDGKYIRYHTTIFNAHKDTFNKSIFEGEQKHRIRLIVCESNLKTFINAGAVLVYVYKDKNGKDVCSVEIDKADCVK